MVSPSSAAHDSWRILPLAWPCSDSGMVSVTTSSSSSDASMRSMAPPDRSEEHTSELQSLMRISYAVFCLKKKNKKTKKERIKHLIQCQQYHHDIDNPNIDN